MEETMKMEDRARVAGLLRAMAARFDGPGDTLDGVEWRAVNDTDYTDQIGRSFDDADTIALPVANSDAGWGEDVERGGVWLLVPVRVVHLTDRAPSFRDPHSEWLDYALGWADEPAPPVSTDYECPWCNAKRSGDVSIETRKRAMVALDTALEADEDPCPVCAAVDGNGE
jgi:hypothetical protein